MWRKRGEAAKPELSGDDPYADQIPLSRAVPLWGGISEKGFEAITFHKKKKLDGKEWAEAAGGLRQAIRKLKHSRRGP